MNPASAKTSLNQVPALHKFVAQLDFSVFDFGAGKEGRVDEFWKSLPRPRVYIPYDPFNRSKKVNTDAWIYLENYGVDVVTCANVLNVCDDSDLINLCCNLAAATRQTRKGLCFVAVYRNPSMPMMVKRKGYIQRNQPLAAYIPFLKKEFTNVTKIGNFLMCSTH